MRKKVILPIMLLVIAGGVNGQTADKPAHSGTCQWYVAHETLTIEPLTGETEGELANWTGDAAPWSEYAESIRDVEVSSTVYAKTVRAMFANMKNLRKLNLSGLNITKLVDAEDLSLTSTDEGYMFYGAQCPSIITLPAPKNIRFEDKGIPLPDFKNVADYIQKVGNGTLYVPNGAKYNSYEDMSTAWDSDKRDEQWEGTYVLMKNATQTTYTVTAATGLGTLCYPEKVNLLSNGEWKVKAYRITGYSIDDGASKLVLTQWNESTLTANTPVLLYKEGGTTLTLPKPTNDISLAPRIINDANDETNLLKGCYGNPTIFGDPDEYVAANSRQYVYQTKNGKTSFYRVNPDKPIYATSFRCYLELPASSVAERQNAAKYDFAIPSDEPTSVLNTLTSQSDNSRQGVYDLQGRRVKEMTPGNVYVVNGVKVVVR